MSEKDKNEKGYTVKGVQSELTKLNKAIEKKAATLTQLKKEMKADKKRYKALLSIFNDLCQEDLQRQIAEVWFKEQKLTGEQVQKFLELSKQLHGKIDQLDVGTVVQVVESTCVQETEQLSASTGEQKEKVDTCINFPEGSGEHTEFAN